ncbi:dihydroneopterin aldolase [Methylobacterium persicinum]|uniref:7,8-dihydroneopterin aldolase n=1 Tax=Methylobacterium persicinum TaxID=374426 RepID=A0ABU0HF80_9HYPH|nr:dihydroneopterin aldolase [Methylobacterium persicinum]MDQ0440955.1 dihydroneopterin aldolase [Methylobacterium persicinum]GJE39895.1 Dihydroneopterin aldolase [Methylobacterium persicinum]
MSDHIRVEGIAVYGRHGVLPEEETLGQRFYLGLDAELALAAAGRADDVALTVSYADLTAIAVAIATERRFKLIEALAETIAQEILAGFPAIAAITVRVDKPSAPVPAILERVGVTITRRREAAQ